MAARRHDQGLPGSNDRRKVAAAKVSSRFAISTLRPFMDRRQGVNLEELSETTGLDKRSHTRGYNLSSASAAIGDTERSIWPTGFSAVTSPDSRISVMVFAR